MSKKFQKKQSTHQSTHKANTHQHFFDTKSNSSFFNTEKAGSPSFFSASPPVIQKQTTQEQENNTGLPDGLKAGVENLSGISLDDVKVHRNSDKPAQVQALAYAQGSDIHLAPGQEKHLPHEAWHVVQQKQGRVQPTAQIRENVNINDNPGLEKEADVMGAKASHSTLPRQLKSVSTKTIDIIQAVGIGKKIYKALQIMYRLFDFKGKSPEGLEEALAKYDDAKFKSASEFLEVFIAENPQFENLADLKTAKSKSIERGADERDQKMRANRVPKKPMKAVVDSDAIEHAVYRHTYEGIEKAKKILSATSGDVAVFPQGTNIDKIAMLINNHQEVEWKTRSGSSVKADLMIDGMTVRVYGDQMGKEVHVETFFPLNLSVPREELQKLWSK